MTKLGKARGVVRYTVTFMMLAGAIVMGMVIWTHYLTGPWTRDGQVLAYVVSLAPEVSGRVVALHVQDNQPVRRGDVLYEIDPTDYLLNVANAQANLNSTMSDLQNKQKQATRRADLTTLSTSQEEKGTYQNSASMAAGSYALAVAQLSQAHVNLDRTKVVSPVNGFITNLQLQRGDYATTGTRNLSVLDSDSFWIVGYFEETKIAGIKPGAPAVAALLGFREPVQGHVESIASGINTPNTQPGALGLASVDPTFTWVRLSQRIPVRIHIDHIPESVTIAAGMTATVTVGSGANPGSWNGLVSRLFTQVGG